MISVLRYQSYLSLTTLVWALNCSATHQFVPVLMIPLGDHYIFWTWTTLTNISRIFALHYHNFFLIVILIAATTLGSEYHLRYLQFCVSMEGRDWIALIHHHWLFNYKTFYGLILMLLYYSPKSQSTFLCLKDTIYMSTWHSFPIQQVDSACGIFPRSLRATRERIKLPYYSTVFIIIQS